MQLQHVPTSWVIGNQFPMLRFRFRGSAREGLLDAAHLTIAEQGEDDAVQTKFSEESLHFSYIATLVWISRLLVESSDPHVADFNMQVKLSRKQ